ncbi:MAG TPA: MarC family protein [Chthoniobacterales bacterium]|jgi:multiple antibiotic resistance protein|nr:MarC family protein [Chthoniobacterales bacterium]
MSEFLHSIAVAFIAMFPMINPIGHAPMFYGMTSDDSAEHRRAMAAKIGLYVFLILTASLFCGNLLLEFFGVTIDDLRIAGGLLVAHSGWGMLNNQSRVTPKEQAAGEVKEDISLTPMAMPILAGPGAMSLAIGLAAYGRTVPHGCGYVIGFAAIALLTWLSFRWSDAMVRVFSVNAVGALNRVLGLFILAIGVNMIVRGVQDVWPH